MQHSRRHTPYPWTWEIPALICMLLGLGLVAAVQVARSVANLLAGGGWTWPVDQARFWRSLPAVVAGRSEAGLDRPVSTSLAGAELVWTCIVLVELVFLIGAGWAIKEYLQRCGPGRVRGMASRTEAEQMLGRARLRKVDAVVRPDLHGKKSVTTKSRDLVRRRFGHLRSGEGG